MKPIFLYIKTSTSSNEIEKENKSIIKRWELMFAHKIRDLDHLIGSIKIEKTVNPKP
jgi:hypothetical protein